MKDLQNSRMMWLKGVLFALIGTIAAVLLIVETRTLKVAVLLALAIWAFCRAYYFAFYVIEHYVDPAYRFSGLWSFVGYCARKKSNSPDDPS
ncbi:MAG TPA: hypothetical protein VL793_08055 [Patescibacteria group bacterium]|jgi:hypothetical protein|nr:hypothetical protein [Patescibacteria group bacterium]